MLMSFQDRSKSLVHNDKNREELLGTVQQLFQEFIDAQDDCFHMANLPPNWGNNLPAVNELDTLITNILKAKKEGPGPLAKLVGDVYSQMHPQLKDAMSHDIQKDPLVTNAAKARLAYLRIMIHLSLLENAKKGHKETTTFWNQINEKLATRPRVMEQRKHCQQRECARHFSPHWPK
ncbi:hypothetical protein VP01_4015g1 [Puccinia sorghi]|uniref:Uncharacterized protein n=1 Tax=Puccinia sorghi TaxID=27349 RepID=A0A0L6USP7_9BASI|nr:hypothetical protein VP01_4015g1 [Puccinia sorghi]